MFRGTRKVLIGLTDVPWEFRGSTYILDKEGMINV